MAVKTENIIRLSKSCLGDEEKKMVLKVLDHEFLGMGEEVKKFEEQLKNFFKRPVVCVNTGTSALHLALQAIGIKPEDEVLVQSMTYVATFQAITAAGAKPIACDINQDNLCIDLKDAKRKISKKTKAIMPVHYAGGVGNLKSLYEFANENNIRVIEDAAHAFGSTYKGKKIGSFGDIACFSFDGIKNITSGEGGCVVSNDKKVTKNIQDARLLGVEKDTEKRFKKQRSWVFDVKNQGWRYHMSNLMAAIGIAQLEKFNEAAKIRQNLAKRYINNLKKCSKVKCIHLNFNEVVPHIFVIKNMSNLDRNLIINKLAQKKIQTGIHYLPNHKLSYFKRSKFNLPVTDTIFNKLITLPLHPDLTFNDVDYVSNSLINILNHVE